jgi:hypothetical protein
MKNILVFPTWALLGVMRPFLKTNHPWKSKKFSLTNWAKGSTSLNKLISLDLWIGFICIIVSLIMLINL